MLLPIVYNAMAAKEAQRKLPLFHALAAALRRSSYYPLLKHPPSQAGLPGRGAECAHAILSHVCCMAACGSRLRSTFTYLGIHAVDHVIVQVLGTQQHQHNPLSEQALLRLRRPCRAPDVGVGAGVEPLFAGPRDLRATLRKHMVAMSEEDKLTEVLGAKRPRSSQVGREAVVGTLTKTRSPAHACAKPGGHAC